MGQRPLVGRRWGGRGRRADEKLLLASALFDHEWYSLQVGETLDRQAAVRDYLESGRHAGRSPHPLFDASSIRLRWSSQRLSELGEGDPLCHYLREQVFSRSTHPLFDIERYLRQAPEALDHPGGPVVHYCEVGAASGRSPAEWLDEGIDLRDWVRAAYLRVTTDAPSETAAVASRPLAAAVVSVLIVADRADDTIGSVRRLAGADSGGTEIVVLDNGTPAVTATSLQALTEYDGVRVVRVPDPLGRADALARLAAEARSTSSLVLGAGARVPEQWVEPLLVRLVDGVTGVQPLLIRGNGTIRSAGWVTGGGRTYPMLAGFPVEDAEGIDLAEIAAASAEALLARTADLRAASAAGALPDGAAGELELAQRLVALHPGAFRVAPDVHVAQRGPGPAITPPHPIAASTNPDDERAWRACGFELTGHDESGAVLRWVGRGDGPAPVRWAIKNAAPAGPIGEVWGDTHFARSLAAELRKLGVHVVIDAHPAWHRASGIHDQVALVIRGPERFRPRPGQIAISWVISHPDTIDPDELRAHDRVVAASNAWAERMSGEWAIEIEPMLQATDADRFHPDVAEPDTGHELLFVGNTREEYRHVVRDAIESGLPLTIYGRGWQHFIDDSYVAGPSIPNTELSAAYRGAGIVLSDHFEDMRRDGFASNRLFDATASGARVITDAIDGIDGLFGGSVQVYRDRDDLVRLATLRDPDAVFGDDAARRAVAADVREKHSFAARARRLVELATDAAADAQR